MSELPYLPEHVHDIMAETASLTNEELGAYMRLRWALWRRGGYLPKRDIEEAVQAGESWPRIGDKIMARLTRAGRIVSLEPLLETLTRTRERRAKAVERAEKAAAARWARNRELQGSESNINENNTLPMLGAFLKHANQNHNQNHIESKSLSMDGTAARSRRAELALNTALYEEGVALLVDRVGVRALAAKVQIGKWLTAVDKPESLVPILRGVVAENLRGHQFVAVVDQRVEAAKRERKRGLSLPFGPKAVG